MAFSSWLSTSFPALLFNNHLLDIWISPFFKLNILWKIYLLVLWAKISLFQFFRFHYFCFREFFFFYRFFEKREGSFYSFFFFFLSLTMLLFLSDIFHVFKLFFPSCYFFKTMRLIFWKKNYCFQSVHHYYSSSFIFKKRFHSFGTLFLRLWLVTVYIDKFDLDIAHETTVRLLKKFKLIITLCNKF